MLSQLRHTLFREHRREAEKKRFWFKRSDIIFLGVFLVLLVASIIVSNIPRSSYPTSLSTASDGATPSNQTAPVVASPAPTSPVVTPSDSAGGQGSATTAFAGAPTFTIGSTDTISATYQQQLQQLQQAEAPPVDCANAPKDPNCVKLDENNWIVGSKHGLLGTTDPTLTFSNPFIGTAWGGMLTIADMFLVLFIIINGLRISAGGMGFRYAEALEALPRIVLAFAAAHLSLLFIACLIGINNGLDDSVLVLAQQNNLGFQGGLDIGSLLGQIVAVLISVIGMFIPGGQLITAVTLGGEVLMAMIGLAVGILYLFLAIQLIIRIALLGMLIIIAPLGFACWALPQGAGQQVMRLWLNATVATILVQFLQLTCYTFGFIVLNPVIGWTVHLNIAGIKDLSVLKMAILWITLRIPGFVQNTVTNTMSDGSRNMSAMISQALGTVTAGISSAILISR